MNQGRPRDPPLHGSLNALEVDYSLSGVGDHFQDYLTACFEYQQPVSYSEEYAAEANDFLRVLDALTSAYHGTCMDYWAVFEKRYPRSPSHIVDPKVRQIVLRIEELMVCESSSRATSVQVEELRLHVTAMDLHDTKFQDKGSGAASPPPETNAWSEHAPRILLEPATSSRELNMPASQTQKADGPAANKRRQPNRYRSKVFVRYSGQCDRCFGADGCVFMEEYPNLCQRCFRDRKACVFDGANVAGEMRYMRNAVAHYNGIGWTFAKTDDPHVLCVAVKMVKKFETSGRTITVLDEGALKNRLKNRKLSEKAAPTEIPYGFLCLVRCCCQS